MAIRDTAASALEATGFELSILFLIFLGINLTWECTLAVLKFLDDCFFGRGSLWIDRVKEEILGLGVISLVLVFLEPELLKICVPDIDEEENSWETEGPDLSTAGRRALLSEDHHPCPEGKMHLFPKVVITASHFLLFYIAVVHIVYSFISFSLTLRRFQSWLGWEQKARTENLRQRYHLGTLEPDTASNLPVSKRVRSGAADEGPGLGHDPVLHQGSGAAGGQKQASSAPGAAAAACCRRCWTGCLSPAWAALTGALDTKVFSGLRDLFLSKAVLTMHVDSASALPVPATASRHDPAATGPSADAGSSGASASKVDPSPSPLSSGPSRTRSHPLEAVPPSVLALTPLSIADLRALHTLHFTNAAEQLVEVELTQVWAHAWALSLFTAIFMLFPQEAWQAVWISGLSVVLTIIIQAKMYTVLHEAAQLGSNWPQQLLAQHEKRQRRERNQGGKRWWQWGRHDAADMEMGAAPHDAKTTAQEPGSSQAAAASPPQAPSSPTGPLPPAPAPAYNPDSALQALNGRASKLLWFHHTMPLLWLINVVFVINSLSITIAIYYLVAYQGAVSTAWKDTLQTWIPLLVADSALALYLGAVVVPQYALVSTCCGHSHASLMRILRSSRRMGLEEEERGVSGLLLGGLFKLKQLCQSCMGRLRHRASGLAAVSQSGELALLSSGGAEVLDVFIRGLAFRAGVILPHGHKAFSTQHQAALPPAHPSSAAAWSGHPPSVLPLYQEMVRVWMCKLAVTGALLDLDPDCVAAVERNDWVPSTELTSALAVLREAFSVIDQDNSGTVTIMELRERLVEVLRVKPTTNELRTMIQLIDIDSSKRISVREMCVFCAHEFFSTGSLHPGAIDVASLRSSLQALGLPPSCHTEACVQLLLAFAAGEEDFAEYRARPYPPPALGLFKFGSLFADLSLLD